MYCGNNYSNQHNIIKIETQRITYCIWYASYLLYFLFKKKSNLQSSLVLYNDYNIKFKANARYIIYNIKYSQNEQYFHVFIFFAVILWYNNIYVNTAIATLQYNVFRGVSMYYAARDRASDSATERLCCVSLCINRVQSDDPWEMGKFCGGSNNAVVLSLCGRRITHV